jgi:A/G-specific adenine glycosylase
MLQQTRAATVIPYYERFLERFPSLEALASAGTEEVLAAWSGLGYYRRARSLHAAAQEVARRFGGRIPGEVSLLRELPGVGAYTAGALASIAFGLPEPALDGNALRVLSRLLAIRGDPEVPGARRVIEAEARALLRKGAPGILTQALMELGALICAPALPRCDRCPVNRACRARAAGLQTTLPETPPKRSAVRLEAVVAVIRRGESYLMIRRAGEDLMRDLWEFPGGFLEKGEEGRRGLARLFRERLGGSLRAGEKMMSLRQTITYRQVTVSAYRATLSEPLPPSRRGRERVRWVRYRDLPRLPHGSATRRILERIGPGPPTGWAASPVRRRR